MRMITALAIFIGMVSAVQAAGSVEENLKQAIQLSNQGRKEEAVQILQGLGVQNPSDDRVFLCLGLIYRSLQRYDDAIRAFERAVSIKASGEGYYSLGLLYEGKAIGDESGARHWVEKAKAAWTSFLRMNPADSKKAEVAARHLKNLEDADASGQK